MNQIFDRDTPLEIVDEFREVERQLEDFKGGQTIGNDNLIIKFYVESMYGQTVAANATAKFKAVFTFDEPPVDSLVTITFDWYDFSVGAYQYTEQRYDDPATMDDLTKQAGIIEFSPNIAFGALAINAFAKSTSKGTLVLTRLL